MARHRRFLLFALIGGGAMFVDIAALWAALHLLHANPYAGRLFSFWCAASTTWIANRHITFKGERAHGLLVEYLRFLGVAAIGGSVNFAVYSMVVGLTPKILALPAVAMTLLPYAGVVVGSLCGLVFNYTGTRLLVFKTPPTADLP